MLVALTVCLGAKAGFTNRGKKIVNFIRGDAAYASSIPFFFVPQEGEAHLSACAMRLQFGFGVGYFDESRIRSLQARALRQVHHHHSNNSASGNFILQSEE